MGIDVSAAKVVTVNDHHQNGVDTSVAGNPTRGRFRGVNLLHVFSRNQKGPRRDDGNPLVHALKGKRGFSILPFWKARLMARAEEILGKVSDELKQFDYVLPIPSSSPFCAEFAALVSSVSGVPVLEPSFLRKRLIGELTAELQANPPKLRPNLQLALESKMRTWAAMDPSATYQAKDVDVMALRPHIRAFELAGEAPDLQGKWVLIVDDVFASGSSLVSGADILRDKLGAKVAGACFLSGV
ncbi:hypothetical protein AB2M62_03360 [Sphingomonas sp. MMS12-HWE2-04]|uniref:hypothetical protein n=1 Tax=Sphingomonas sp. MMS12-HWE2-04 TaxID=3234199 RepID=UPI0038500409